MLPVVSLLFVGIELLFKRVLYIAGRYYYEYSRILSKTKDDFIYLCAFGIYTVLFNRAEPDQGRDSIAAVFYNALALLA